MVYSVTRQAWIFTAQRWSTSWQWYLLLSLIVCTGVIITVLSSQFTVTMAVLHNIWHWRCMLFYSFWFNLLDIRHISALMLLVGRQERHLTCKKTEWWGAGMVICLELGADLHMAQLMPLPLTVSCYSKIQIGFIFLVPAHLGSPGKRAIKRVCVCLCVCVCRCMLFNSFWCNLLDIRHMPQNVVNC